MVLDASTYEPLTAAEMIQRYNSEAVFTLKLERKDSMKEPKNTNGKLSQIGTKTGGANTATTPDKKKRASHG